MSPTQESHLSISSLLEENDCVQMKKARSEQTSATKFFELVRVAFNLRDIKKSDRYVERDGLMLPTRKEQQIKQRQKMDDDPVRIINPIVHHLPQEFPRSQRRTRGVSLSRRCRRRRRHQKPYCVSSSSDATEVSIEVLYGENDVDSIVIPP